MKPSDLREALAHFATGVVIVTGLNEQDEPIGLTINSFSSVSLDPPLVLWSLSNRSPNLGAFGCGRPFVINILSGRQRDVCLRFAKPAEDKFADVKTRPGLGKVPLLLGSLAHLECRTEQAIPAGDHRVFIARVEGFQIAAVEAPLIFHRSRLSQLQDGLPC